MSDDLIQRNTELEQAVMDLFKEVRYSKIELWKLANENRIMRDILNAKAQPSDADFPQGPSD